MTNQLTLTFDDMTTDQMLIWQALDFHKGKENAVTQNALAETTRIPQRRVRECIQNLIVKHGKLICSSYKSKGGGYYIPVTPGEIEEVTEILHGHALNILKRESRLRKISTAELMKRYQRELEFDDQTTP